MVELNIERRIIERIQAILIGGERTVGVWSAAEPGEVKGVVDEDTDAVVSVGVGMRQYDTHEMPMTNIPVSIGVAVRGEEDQAGARFLDIVGRIMEIVQGWQNCLELACDDISTPDFTPAGFRIDGGTAPAYDGALNVWNATANFTVRGTCI